MEGVEEAYLRATGQKLAVRQAQRGFEIATAQYSEGLGSQLELTDAEVERVCTEVEAFFSQCSS